VAGPPSNGALPPRPMPRVPDRLVEHYEQLKKQACLR